MSRRFSHALVVGVSGGIGLALADRIGDTGLADKLSGWSRRPCEGPIRLDTWSPVDITDESSIAAAAAELGEVDLVIVATGLLHRDSRPPDTIGLAPEKTLRALDPVAMAEAFAVNAIGPALVAKHVLPLLPRSRHSVFAALSARVGSIGDNRLGGWHSYRASKAALNQIIRTLSIELRRTHPAAICVGLHPGTVDTTLSGPFQSAVAPVRLFTPAIAAGHLIDVIENLDTQHSGDVLDWAGKRIPC